MYHHHPVSSMYMYGVAPVKAKNTTLDITINTRTRGLWRYLTLFRKRRPYAVASIIKDYGQPSAHEIAPPEDLTARRGHAGSWNLQTRFDVEDNMLERDGLMLVIVIWHDQAFRGKKISVEVCFRVRDLLERSREGEQVGEVLTWPGEGNVYFGFKFGPRITRRISDEVLVHSYASESYQGVRAAPSAPYVGYLNEANTEEEKPISSSDILVPVLGSDLGVMQL